MSEPKTVHEETMCCGYKRCPAVKIFDDGSAELTDDDPEAGSVGTIKLRPEVVERFVVLATARKR
jgi:hypothetical protein